MKTDAPGRIICMLGAIRGLDHEVEEDAGPFLGCAACRKLWAEDPARFADEFARWRRGEAAG